MVNFNYTTNLLISDKLHKKGKLIFWDDNLVSKVDIQLCKFYNSFISTYLLTLDLQASKQLEWPKHSNLGINKNFPEKIQIITFTHSWIIDTM